MSVTGNQFRQAQFDNGESFYAPANNTAGTTGLSSLGMASAGISTIGGIISGAMQTEAFKEQLKAETDAAIANAGNVSTSFELQMAQTEDIINNLNDSIGNKMSERGLNAIKEASLLKAASAESGTSGGTTEAAIKEAFINEHMDKANIINAGKQQLAGLMRSIDTAELSAEHKIDSILLGGKTSISGNPLMTGLAGGVSSFTNTLGMLSNEDKANLFGIRIS